MRVSSININFGILIFLVVALVLGFTHLVSWWVILLIALSTLQINYRIR